MSERAARVLLADAHPLLRAGLRTLLADAQGLHVVGEASDGEQALALTRRLLPDVVVLDAQLPRLAGVGELTGALAALGSATRVLVLAASASEVTVLAALRAGAAGFLVKDSPTEELIGAVRAVAGGGAAISPQPLRWLLTRVVPLLPETTGPTPSALAVLTERERQVLIQVAGGLNNTEIAAQLTVSETTVKTHVGHVLTKLSLRDRVQAVVLAYETGLVRPGGTAGGYCDK